MRTLLLDFSLIPQMNPALGQREKEAARPKCRHSHTQLLIIRKYDDLLSILHLVRTICFSRHSLSHTHRRWRHDLLNHYVDGTNNKNQF